MSIIKVISKYYRKIPVEILNVVAPLYHLLPKEVRYGKTYKIEKEGLHRISSLTDSAVAAERNLAVQRLLRYCYEHVQYYKELFDKNNIDINDISGVEDLERIPFLTKELLIQNRDKLISDEFSKKQLLYITTSGSTGTPAAFYVQPESHMRDWVYVEKMFKSYGYSIDSSKLVLRGRQFKNQEKGLNWQWDGFRKELSINIFELTPENMDTYCEVINKYKPEFGYGYLSAMYAFCKYLKATGRRLKHHFNAFIAISESIHDEQRAFVESVIEAPVLSFYGMSERVVIAGQKKSGGAYYVEPLYGVMELIDDDGSVIKTNGKLGEIVGTGLLNYGMPLIRYKMADSAAWSNYLEGKIERIEGRKNKDILINHDGIAVSMAALEVHTDAFEKVYRYQFFQNEKGKVIIKVVPIQDKQLTDIEMDEIKRIFTNRVNNKIDFSIQIVRELLPKENGKFSIIDQQLSVSKYM